MYVYGAKEFYVKMQMFVKIIALEVECNLLNDATNMIVITLIQNILQDTKRYGAG